ncbi:MAG: hypothetical protein IPJ00_20440 [Saprospirales bacterium]|nr:hypothetical protein [Saprospirales bacterium]
MQKFVSRIAATQDDASCILPNKGDFRVFWNFFAACFCGLGIDAADVCDVSHFVAIDYLGPAWDNDH